LSIHVCHFSFLHCLQEWLVFAKRRGWRLNLRFLAEVQTLAWLLLLGLLTYWFWQLWSSAGLAHEGSAAAAAGHSQGTWHHQQQAAQHWHQPPPQQQQQWQGKQYFDDM
jgi:hypothetical protein